MLLENYISKIYCNCFQQFHSVENSLDKYVTADFRLQKCSLNHTHMYSIEVMRIVVWPILHVHFNLHVGESPLEYLYLLH